VKFFARGDSEVDAIDVDVLRDNVWVDVYDGPVNNLAWMQANFTQGLVGDARVRFSTPYTNHGFFWELYELVIQKSSATSNVSCLDLSNFLYPNYLPKMPFDPSVGTLAKTYYSVRRENGNTFAIFACYSELGEYFKTSR